MRADSTSLKEEIARLRSELSRTQRLLYMVILFIGSLLLFGAGPTSEVTCTKLLLTNSEGTPVISLRSNPTNDGGDLVIKSKNGKDVLRLGISENGGGLSITNTRGTRCFMGLSENGGQLIIMNGRGEDAIRLAPDKYGCGSVVIRNGAKDIWSAP